MATVRPRPHHVPRRPARPREKRSDMASSMFVTVEEVQSDLDVSRSHAYRIIRDMNEELRKRGYLTIAGRVSRKNYEERLYGEPRTSERGA